MRTRFVPVLVILTFLSFAALVSRQFLALQNDSDSPDLRGGPVEREEPRLLESIKHVPQPQDSSTPELLAPQYAGVEEAVLAIHVRQAHGRPAVGAVAILASATNTILGHAITDADGVGVLPRPIPGSSIIILGATLPAHKEPAKQACDEQWINLPEGIIEGRVVVDGAPPIEPLLLQLHPNSESYVAERLPHELVKSISLYLLLHHRVDIRGQTTGPGGTFAFGGLRDGWEGYIQVPYGYHLDSGTFSISVRAPSTALEIRLNESPSIRGRIFEDDWEPSPFATGRYTFRTGLGETGGGVTSDENGSFRLALSRNGIDSGSIILVSRDGRKKRILALGALPPDADLDLGNVVLFSGRDVPFVVVDHNGRAVSGARAWPLDDTVKTSCRTAASAPTDNNGNSTLLSVLESTTHMRVGALSRPSVDVPIPLEVIEPIRVQLTEGTGLDVRLVDNAGAPASFFTIALRSEVKPFIEKPDLLSAQAAFFSSASIRNTAHDENGLWFVFEPTSPGRVLLTCLNPGVPLQIQPLAAGDVPHGERISIVPTPGRIDVVEFTIDAKARTIWGRVVDRSGTAIDRARVIIRPQGALTDARALKSRTDSAGFFSVTSVYGKHFSISTTAKGYAPGYLENIFVPQVGRELEITLDQGVNCVVRVLSSAGQPITANFVRVERQGQTIGWGGEIQPGIYRCEDLPNSPIDLVVSVAGRRLRQTLVPVRFYDFKLPNTGSLEVEWSGVSTPARDVSLIIQPEDRDMRVVLVSLRPQQHREGTILDVPVMFPGNYRISIEGWTEEGESIVLSPVVPVTICANRKTLVSLEP